MIKNGRFGGYIGNFPDGPTRNRKKMRAGGPSFRQTAHEALYVSRNVRISSTSIEERNATKHSDNAKFMFGYPIGEKLVPRAQHPQNRIKNAANNVYSVGE